MSQEDAEPESSVADVQDADGSAEDDFARAIVIATTGAALFVAGAEADIDSLDGRDDEELKKASK